jgi:hypothetical protein
VKNCPTSIQSLFWNLVSKSPLHCCFSAAAKAHCPRCLTQKQTIPSLVSSLILHNYVYNSLSIALHTRCWQCFSLWSLEVKVTMKAWKTISPPFKVNLPSPRGKWHCIGQVSLPISESMGDERSSLVVLLNNTFLNRQFTPCELHL